MIALAAQNLRFDFLCWDFLLTSLQPHVFPASATHTHTHTCVHTCSTAPTMREKKLLFRVLITRFVIGESEATTRVEFQLCVVFSAVFLQLLLYVTSFSLFFKFAHSSREISIFRWTFSSLETPPGFPLPKCNFH